MPFLARSEAAFDTILPSLFFFKFSFFRPPLVFTLKPCNTMTFANLPFAITDFFIAFFFIAFAFITFFMAFLAFMGVAFMAFFMAFMAFMAGLAFSAFMAAFMATFFIGKAMAKPCVKSTRRDGRNERQGASLSQNGLS